MAEQSIEARPAQTKQEIILASASPSRRKLLENAAIIHRVVPAFVDEDEIKLSMKEEGLPVLGVAEALAELKAHKVSRQHPESLVIGADQMLDLEGEWFDKPADLSTAACHLRALRGKTHSLPTAVVVYLGGQRIWHHLETPHLTMRSFSDAFIEEYLERAGEAVLTSVGGYQLEGPGVQLFSKVEGNFFAILGLPLLPLLSFLRDRGLLAT